MANFHPPLDKLKMFHRKTLFCGSDNITEKKNNNNKNEHDEAIYILNQLVVLPESQHIHPEAIENKMKNK